MYGPAPQMHMGLHPTQMMPHPNGPVHHMPTNWGYGPTMQDSQRYVTHFSGPVSAHPRGHIETADMIGPTGYQLLDR